MNPGSQANLIWVALTKRGLSGGTCYELAETTKLSHVQVARLMITLERNKLVERTTTTRYGDAGTRCTVWKALPRCAGVA